MKELVVISGKGGTGKTSIVAAFAALAKESVFADCDVDAADLHLILEPQVEHDEVFKSGKKASIVAEECVACNKCDELCVFDAVRFDGPGNGAVEKTYRIDPISCDGCGVCVRFCPTEAIQFNEAECGRWFISRTRFGSMVHAKLGIAEDNSGKLVSLVREQARNLAAKNAWQMVIIDGPPGIGCPVIASITGANLVLVLTEPTLSGLHDLERVRELTRHFGIKTLVCINKYDINTDLTAQIERQAEELDTEVIGKVRYDEAFTQAQIHKQSVVEYDPESEVSQEIQSLWESVMRRL